MDVRATVVRVGPSGAWVRVEDRAGGCGRCDEPGGCRSIQLTQAFGPQRDEFPLPVDVAVRVGDRVRLRIQDGAPLRGALLAYGLPLAGLLGGALLAAGLAPLASADANVLLGGGAGLVAGWGGGRRLACRFALQPEVEILAADAENPCGGLVP